MLNNFSPKIPQFSVYPVFGCLAVVFFCKRHFESVSGSSTRFPLRRCDSMTPKISSVEAYAHRTQPRVGSPVSKACTSSLMRLVVLLVHSNSGKGSGTPHRCHPFTFCWFGKIDVLPFPRNFCPFSGSLLHRGVSYLGADARHRFRIRLIH